MKKILIILVSLAASTIIIKPLQAHHTMEYIEIESASTAKQFEFVLHGHFDYFVDNSRDAEEDHWELTPGLAFGILDNLMIDIHGHFAKFGKAHVPEKNRHSQRIVDYISDYNLDKWAYIDTALSLGMGLAWAEQLNFLSKSEKFPQGPPPLMEAFALSLQYRILDGEKYPLDLAVAAFYELPTLLARRYLASEMVFGGTFILGKTFGMHNNITLNLSYERDGSENVFHWGLGGKVTLSKHNENAPSLGLEILGDFKGHFGIMPGFYAGIGPNTVIKIGVFTGFSQFLGLDDDEKEEDLRFNTTIMTKW